MNVIRLAKNCADGENAASMHQKLLKWTSWVVVGLALAFPFFLGLEKISESDTFWHLKAGEWILSHSAVPHADPFSATVGGKQWLDWEWLFQAGLYVVYGVGGFKALVLVKALVVFLCGVVLFVASRRNGAGARLSGLLIMIAFVAARERLEVRPDVLMLLFAAITVFILESARQGKLRWLVGLPVLQAIWVNIHGSFLLGLGLIAIYALALGVEFLLRKKWKLAVWMLVALLTACAACLINPFGLQLVSHAIEQTQSSSPAGTIGEWQPTRLLLLTEPNWALRVFWWLFWVNPAVLLGVLVIKRREFPWAHALVVAAMSVLALKANRFTAVYAVVTAPVLAHGLACWRTRFARKSPRAWAAIASQALCGGVAVFLIAIVVTNAWAMAEDRPPKFGLGIDESVVPMRPMDIMAKLPAGLNVFNTFLSGGPLIWQLDPQWRVFCDGRANLYGRDFVDQYRAAMFDPLEWEKWMRLRFITVAYLQYGTADDRALLQYLVRSHVWDMLYFDHAACIFVHQSAWPQLRADKQLIGFKPVRVTDATAVLAYAHELADETAGRGSYGRSRVVTTVGNFLMALGAVDTAEALFEDAIQTNPRPSQAWMNLATIKLNQGHETEALQLTDKLLAINPCFFYARLLQAQIKATQGDMAAAIDETESVLRQQPHSAQAWLLRAQLAARDQDRPGAINALQRTIAEQVEDPRLYQFLGQLLAAEGRTNEAVAAYEKCLSLWTGPTKERDQIESTLAALRGNPKK